jgi:hypothetical protein
MRREKGERWEAGRGERGKNEQGKWREGSKQGKGRGGIEKVKEGGMR